MKKVLIVDDSMMDRKLMTRVLTKNEVPNEIIYAEDGEQALEVVAENYNDIALILLDYQMPKMSGIEFLQAIVKVPATAGLNVFMVTASSSPESRKLAYDSNPNLAGYIIKPYKPDDVMSLIRPYLDS